MLALILFVAFGLLFAYFATLNTSVVTLHLFTGKVDNVPLYVLVLACLFIGILFSSIFYIVKSFTSGFTSHKLTKELELAKKSNADLTRKNHQLELENTRLKAQNGEPVDDEESL